MSKLIYNPKTDRFESKDGKVSISVATMQERINAAIVEKGSERDYRIQYSEEYDKKLNN